MSELQKLQELYGNFRIQTADADLSLQKSRAKLDNLNAREEQELKGLDAQTRDEKKSLYEEQRKKLTAEIETLRAGKKSLKDFLASDLDNLSINILAELDPIERVNELKDSLPILLFPLRLETRFKSTGNQRQLWLRVYPDDCNINKKEELLSESELTNAKSFWIEMWKAGGIEADERGAWRSLVNSHGSGRAAWIIEQYKPGNDKPSRTEEQRILAVVSPLVLSSSEHEEARKYWAEVWLAKGNQQSLDEAFNALKNSVGDAKANEIIEKYIPANISDELPAGVVKENILLENLELASDEEFTATRTSWTQAPKAVGLPDRFAAILYNGENKKTILFDKPVKENLPVGPDPSLNADEQIKKDANGDIIINKELKWMVDFDTAVGSGMAVRINLTSEEASRGFDKLFVVGIRLSSNPSDSEALLEKLFTDHFHSKDGFGLLKQGTPTNNTEDEPAGYSWLDDADESYERILNLSEEFDEKDDFVEASDGQKLADGLGIDAEILKKVPNAGGRDQLEANAMNVALFPATLGYFMEEMMNPLFSDEDIDATKLFFSNFVSGRGPIPAVRIGKQPYGILPVSVYSKLKFGGGTDEPAFRITGESSYLQRLHSLLMKIDASWDAMLPQVSFVGKSGDAHQILLNVIGLHANSVEFHQRYAQSLQQLYNQLVLQFGVFFPVITAAAIAERGRTILRDLGIDLKDKNLPILEKYFLSEPNRLTGPLIDDVPNSEFTPIRPYSADNKNYIEWMVASDADKIRTENFGGNPAPNALLYLLLRHALMQTQADAATQFLLTNNIVQNKNVFFDPNFVHVQTQNGGKSKFEHLYNPNPTVTGSDTLKLVEHIYKPVILKESVETKRLRETLDALEILEKTPTARLERLLVEHLDCCNYRIDAWKTGLVNYRLFEQRTINRQRKRFSKELYLGAYGWLLDVKPENNVLTDVNLSNELNEIFNQGKDKPIQKDSANLGYIHAPSLNQAAAAAILRNAYDSNKNSGSGNPFAINLTSERVRLAENFLEGMRNGQSLAALLGYRFERGLHDKYGLGQGEVDKFIYPLRKVFPLVADNMEDTKSETTDSIQTVAASNVIDGLKLIKHVENSSVKTYPFGLPASHNLPAANSAQTKALDDEVKRMMEIRDAISDLVLAEQVYQVVQGNFERASGNADAYSKGSYPPDVEVKNTPRSGTTVTQKTAVQFDTEADPNISPNTVPMSERAKAEPAVNKWLSSVFPNPENVLCKVTYSSPKDANVPVTVSQKDLGLQAIDLLYCFNLDVEAAMNELDDRIFKYVRSTVSKHPKTDLKINYTEPIDAVDKTKISFFELAGLVKSLRKILISAKFLSPESLTLSGEIPSGSIMDDALLKTRINTLKGNLTPIQMAIGTLITNIKSIGGLKENLKTELSAHISDVAKVEAIVSQMQPDLKDYLVNPVSSKKIEILDNFENSILFIADAVIIADLKNKYEASLDAYLADFPNFDQLTEDTAKSFLSLAMFDNNQTGTGFINQGISGIYSSFYTKLDKLIARWEQKNLDYAALISTFDPAGVEEEQYNLLQKVESLISSRVTFPSPATLNAYKTVADNKKSSFDNLLSNLKTLKSNAREKVTEFIVEAESHVQNVGNHDLVFFDTENERNDLKAEKLLLALLKEDIKIALDNAAALIADKISSSEALIAEADATVINRDKITALQNAAKKILGEEALVLPHFTLSDAEGGELENCYRSSESLLDFVKTNEGRIFPVEDWLGGVSRVRGKMHEWENATFLAGAFSPAVTMEFAPLQFPYTENDRWLAMKFKDETDPNDEFKINQDKLLYTTHFAVAFEKAKPQCGIIIDEWTEIIPSDEETTGIAFHYNQPNSEPPQTMLLVTPPQLTGNWKWDDIIESLEETLEMAMKRAVEPSQIETTDYAQFLPTTMMAVTLYWITVATNLAVNNNFYQRLGDGD